MATGNESRRSKRSARVTPLEDAGATELSVGEVGYLVTGLKDLRQVKVGDTITLGQKAAWTSRCPATARPSPWCTRACFPSTPTSTSRCEEALEKLSLNDPALIWEPETSHALGFGFRVGFLGLLHMEVVKERLEREFGLDLLATAPSVEYHVYRQRRPDDHALHSPQEMPDPGVDRAHRGAVSQGEDPHPARLRGRRHGSHRGAPRRRSSP